MPSTPHDDPSGPPRFPSGALYLDEILGGGLLRGGVYVVSGPPGTGKTTLANQIAFAAAERGESTVYATLLAETHDRMTLHLSTLSFFRREAVGSRVHYVSGSKTLHEDGSRALLDMLGRSVRDHGAALLVVDGFSVLKEQTQNVTEQRQFLQALSTHMNLQGCTAVLLATENEKGTDIEKAMVDGVIALSADLHGLKATRGVEVIKLRGSDNLPGKHTFRISRDGFQVYPRFEASFASTSTRVPDPARRISWGVRDLDAMSDGGLVELSSTLVLGSPGSGKTLLGMSFLAEGAARGEKSLYLGFAETGLELVRKCANVGIDLQPHIDSGALRMEVRAPVETLPDALAQELVTLVDTYGFNRLFLDGLEPFAKEALDPERTTRFVTAMLNAMRQRGVTIIVTQQTNELFGPELHAPIRGVEAICDNVVFLRFFELYGRLHRLVTFLKMRDSANDPFLRELEITREGLKVGASYAAIEALMTGQPRNRAGDGGPHDPRASAPTRSRTPSRKRKPSAGRGRKRGAR